jgi:hypothetical protein
MKPARSVPPLLHHRRQIGDEHHNDQDQHAPVLHLIASQRCGTDLVLDQSTTLSQVY